MRVLSYEEEKKLSIIERKKYYIDLKNYLKGIKYISFSNTHLAFSRTINKEVKGIVYGIKGYELITDGRENIPSNEKNKVIAPDMIMVIEEYFKRCKDFL